MERLPVDRDHRDAAQRHEEHRRPRRRRQLAPDLAPELRGTPRASSASASRSGCGRRGSRLVELRRHRLARAEVDHVERAERHHLRHARPRPPPSAARARPRGRRRRARRRARSSSRRARPRGSRPRRAPPSTGRRCRSRGRRAPRSRAPRAARRASVTHGVVTPNIVAATSGFASSGGTVAWTIPAIAPAALAMIRAEIRLTPEMSTTEYIIVTSTAPTYGRVSPEASVETISFGTPDRERAHRARRDRRAARAAEGEHALEPPLLVQPQHDGLGAGAHRLDRGAAVAAARELGHVGAGRARDLVAVDVGRDPDRLVHAGVDHERLDALREQAVAEERVLGALRVERPEQRDGHSPTPSPPAARRRGTAAAARRRAVSSAAVVSAAIEPATITSSRSAIEVATPRFCSIRSTDRPSSDELPERLDQLLDDRRREPLRGLVHHEQRRVRRAAPARSRASAARRRRAPRRRSASARRGAGRARRCRRPSSACRSRDRRPSAGARRPTARGRGAGPAARSRSRAWRSGRRRARRARCRRSGSSRDTRAGGTPMIALQRVVLPMPFRPMIDVAPRLQLERDVVERLRRAVVRVQALDDEQRLQPSWPYPRPR